MENQENINFLLKKHDFPIMEVVKFNLDKKIDVLRVETSHWDVDELGNSIVNITISVDLPDESEITSQQFLSIETFIKEYFKKKNILTESITILDEMNRILVCDENKTVHWEDLMGSLQGWTQFPGYDESEDSDNPDDKG